MTRNGVRVFSVTQLLSANSQVRKPACGVYKGDKLEQECIRSTCTSAEQEEAHHSHGQGTRPGRPISGRD